MGRLYVNMKYIKRLNKHLIFVKCFHVHLISTNTKSRQSRYYEVHFLEKENYSEMINDLPKVK